MRPTPNRRAPWTIAAVFGLMSGLLAFVVLVVAGAARAQQQVQPLVADLSKHLVAITTAFSGTDVLLFGATDGPGDLVLVVRGPPTRKVVRKKARVAGLIWANRDSVTFDNVPAFYQVFASRPLDKIAPASLYSRHQIGTEHLTFTLADKSVTDSFVPGFRAALVRLKKKQELYGSRILPVTQLANRLFRAELHFPANIATGAYRVEVYLIRDGDVVSAEITPLIISKIGLGAEIFDFAHNRAALYGLTAIIVAMVTGWLAAIVLRRN
ncbi:TIGR02186 family protein [uncultured Rhodospira sp.]|uniref:TIGR02186 family protein n=1 Tax=uncultured Rhodospira sp. TaxID=1936189 RepID=UPI002612C666|nr:TIGR02186 family protein [uncultured Rhodospira sp.]